MGDPSAGAPPAAPEGGAPGPDMLDAIGGGSPEGALPEGMPPEGAEPAPEDPMAPTPEGAKDTANPSDSVTRGQADVTMDIVERTLSAVGEGRTKEQAKAEFDLEQQGKTKEQERKDSEASAKAAAGPITGQPSTPGGPLGALGGQIDPNSIGGVPKLAREGLFKKG